MYFDLTDEQQAIKSTANGFLASRFKSERIREIAASESGFDEAGWKEMAELGWAGLALPEEWGGQGLGTVELAVLFEEMGYALGPSPLLSNTIAGLALAAGALDEQKERWLRPLAEGEVRGTPALIDADGPAEPMSFSMPAGDTLSGEKTLVLDAGAADFFLVATADGGRHVATLPGSGEDYHPVFHRACVALAAESTGLAQRALEMSVEYAKDRQQFGRPIGAYQAVSHRCAQMLLETENSRSAVFGAAWAADAEPESLPLAASMAKAYASDAGWRVPDAAIQVHGGIGFTWEHDLHFFLKRGRANAAMFGDAKWHRERVADSVLAGETAPASA
jgi:alkylation response protein AidB-like acyl-CoA dehydrogenase